MRSLLLVAWLASTGCSGILGFDGFKEGSDDSGSSSGSDDGGRSIVPLTGHVGDRQGTPLVGVGIAMADRNGVDQNAGTVTDSSGNFVVFAPGFIVDGYLHLSYGNYLDTYVHLPEPTGQGVGFDVSLISAGDLVAMQNEGGVVPVASTGTLLIDTGGREGISVECDDADGPAGGTVRYLDAAGTVSPTATATSTLGYAILFNLPDDFYYPRVVGTENARGYAVAPGTYAQVELLP